VFALRVSSERVVVLELSVTMYARDLSGTTNEPLGCIC